MYHGFYKATTPTHTTITQKDVKNTLFADDFSRKLLEHVLSLSSAEASRFYTSLPFY